MSTLARAALRCAANANPNPVPASILPPLRTRPPRTRHPAHPAAARRHSSSEAMLAWAYGEAQRERPGESSGSTARSTGDAEDPRTRPRHPAQPGAHQPSPSRPLPIPSSSTLTLAPAPALASTFHRHTSTPTPTPTPTSLSQLPSSTSSLHPASLPLPPFSPSSFHSPTPPPPTVPAPTAPARALARADRKQWVTHVLAQQAAAAQAQVQHTLERYPEALPRELPEAFRPWRRKKRVWKKKRKASAAAATAAVGEGEANRRLTRQDMALELRELLQPAPSPSPPRAQPRTLPELTALADLSTFAPSSSGSSGAPAPLPTPPQWDRQRAVLSAAAAVDVDVSEPPVSQPESGEKRDFWQELKAWVGQRSGTRKEAAGPPPPPPP
ncbi:hypothetical protein CALCODRAFT_481964, partial [Calocera cornea HHB12733]